MPTKRTKRTRQRRDADMPAWARHLKETGEHPARDDDSADWHAFLGWYFFGEKVPGLGDWNDHRVNWRD